ncbi:MAG: magnesium transporter [Rickettsiales bacterium]|jgi:Mg/Co/Ni transporter MgtE|nr:magnesium transporter [Rickettsiales bacterium]
MHDLIIKRLKNALKMGLTKQIQQIFPSVHPKHQAKLIERLETDERKILADILGERIKVGVLINLKQSARYEMIGFLDKRHTATLLIKLLQKEVVVDEINKEIDLLENQKDNMFETIGHSIIQRLPWLIASIFLSSMSSFVVDSYNDLIEKFVIISALMPVISNISNISEGQTTTILVRDLGRVEDLIKDWKRIITRETIIGFCNGFILSVIMGIVLYVWKSSIALSLCFTLSVFLVQGVSCLFGAVIPLIFQKFKFDPALGADMVSAAIIDVISFAILLKLSLWFLI